MFRRRGRRSEVDGVVASDEDDGTEPEERPDAVDDGADADRTDPDMADDSDVEDSEVAEDSDGAGDEDADEDSDGEASDAADDPDKADGSDVEDSEVADHEDEDTGDDADAVDAQVVYELADWGARERRLLDAQLTAADVTHLWESGDLVVPAALSDRADDLIDLVEDRLQLDLPVAGDTVVYDVDSWPRDLQEMLVEALVREEIRHRRDITEVVVAADDEERVDSLIDEVRNAGPDDETDPEAEGDDLDDDGEDGADAVEVEVDAQEVLSELFLGADKLMKNPTDGRSARRIEEGAETVAVMALPFGFERDTWAGIAERTVALAEQLSDEEADEDAIVDAATELRVHLRDVV